MKLKRRLHRQTMNNFGYNNYYNDGEKGHGRSNSVEPQLMVDNVDQYGAGRTFNVESDQSLTHPEYFPALPNRAPIAA